MVKYKIGNTVFDAEKLARNAFTNAGGAFSPEDAIKVMELISTARGNAVRAKLIFGNLDFKDLVKDELSAIGIEMID